MEKILEEIQHLKSLILGQNLLHKQVLNLSEAALFLELSPSHLYKLTSTNAIPHYKPSGKKIYFERQELESWLMKNRIESSDNIEKEASNYLLKQKR